MTKKKSINPFYVLLLLAGVAFAITATAYGVMTVRQLQASRGYGRTDVAGDPSSSDSFNDIVDQHGATAMIWEIVLLGVGTFGAIAYDQRLDRVAVDNSNAQTSTETSSAETSQE